MPAAAQVEYAITIAYKWGLIQGQKLRCNQSFHRPFS